MEDVRDEEVHNEDEPAQHPWERSLHLLLAAPVHPELQWGRSDLDERLYAHIVDKEPDEELRWQLWDENSEASQRMEEFAAHHLAKGKRMAERNKNGWEASFIRTQEELVRRRLAAMTGEHGSPINEPDIEE